VKASHGNRRPASNPPSNSATIKLMAKCEEISEVEGPGSPPVSFGLPEHGHQVMRIFGKNTTWLLLDRAGLKVGALLAGLVLIGYLGPANVGIYTTAIALGSLLNTVLDLGLTRYGARVVAASPQEAPSILALTLTTTVLATVVELAAVGVAYTTGHWYATCLCVGFIFTNLEGTSSLCTGILSADLRSRSVLPGSILSTLGVVAVIALVVHFKLSVLALLTGLAVKSLIALIYRLNQLRGYWPLSAAYFLPQQFVRLVKSSWAYFSYSLTQTGYEKVSIISLGLVADHEQVGLLSAAMVMASIFPSFTYAAADALLPVMTRLYEAGRIPDLLELRRRLMNLLLFLCVPVGIILAIFAPELCRLLGDRFVSSAPILRITASRSLLAVLDNFLGQAGLTAIDRVAERRNSQAMGLGICAVLTIVLGYRWGALGAATATLLADGFILGRYLRTYAKAGLRVEYPGAWSCAIAGATMVLACFLLPIYWWPLRAAASTGIFLTVLAMVAPHRLAETASTFRQCFIRAEPA
jgi:O-antigen/teichoic acid export membrane protein